MNVLDTLRHLVEHSPIWVDDAEKAAHLAALEASDLATVLQGVATRLEALETRLAALETSMGYNPAHTLATDPGASQDPGVATGKASS